jgi:non-specific serine/threonine protein kinase
VDTSSFALLLRQHRLARGLTQEALAERAGLSERGISDLERGLKQAPRLSTVRMLVRGLGLQKAEAAALLRAAQPSRERVPDDGHGELHNLPLSTTSFVGRKSALALLERALLECRLATITGAGGCGKTRLALETARMHIGHLDDGVWLVELASLADGSLVTQTIATTLGIPSVGHPPADVLTEYLCSRQVLLVLDNCEHLIEACALLVERLLQSCPGLRVLATSRERLDVPGEVVHRLAGLELPAEEASACDVARSEAGQLFLERARRHAPDLGLDEHEAAALARICRRLDGIPLALELASSAARAVSLEDLAVRLDDRFRLLQGTGWSTPPRHRTLRAAIDWSHQLLHVDEAALFRRLAVFAGGFNLAAVEAVDSPDALRVLLRLIDKSLVLVERRGSTQRYRMHEIVREYAEEKLVDSGEAALFRNRHRDYYLALSEEGAVGLVGPDQIQWDQRLETEYENLRTALAWCRADPDGADHEERLAGALGRFWQDRGYVGEGFAWLAHAVERRPGVVSVERGRALNWAGVIAQHLRQGQPTVLLGQSVAVLRQTQAMGELSVALRHLASVSWSAGAASPETSLVDEALLNARAAGDPREIGWGLLFLSQIALTSRELAKARQLADEAVAQLHGLDPRSRLNASLQLGRVAIAQCEYEYAETVFREMVEYAHEIGERFKLPDPWLGLAGSVAARGDPDGARGCLRQLVIELRAASCAHLLPRVLLGLAMLEAGDRQEWRAARLLGAFQASGSRAAGWPLEGYRLGPDLATLRARLEHEPFDTALLEGRALTVDQALDEALASAPELSIARVSGAHRSVSQSLRSVSAAGSSR